MSGQNWFSYCKSDPVNRSDVSGTTDLSDAELSKMLGQLADCLMYSSEAKVIAEAGLAFCQNWLLGEFVATGFDMKISDPELVRKQSWITTFEEETAISTPGFGSVKEKAESEGVAYTTMLELAMWVTGNPDL